LRRRHYARPPRPSAGRNPYYRNERKTVEAHLLHAFPVDFYGRRMRLVVCGYMRPELNFPSLEALIAAIAADIRVAGEQLAGEAHAAGAAAVMTGGAGR
jgi:FAD synthase